MDVRTLYRDLIEVVSGAGEPGGTPRRPRWLRRHIQPALLVLTLLLILAARANVPHGLVAQLVAVAGAIPLALITVRPLVAWRVAWVAALFAQLAPAPHERAWPWNPVQIWVFLPVLFIVGATQRVGVSVGVWLFTCGLVFAEANQGNQPGIVILVSLLMLVGDQLRRRRRAQQELAQEEERSAVLAERTRIARELHDVVAHHMSLIAVRAETAPYRLAGLAEPVRDEFGQISAQAREALTEMRRLLGVLRSERYEAPVAPQPGLADLPELVAAAQRAGTPVELTMPEDQAGLPQGVELTAYRIVQEALSNVARHAPGAAATVTLARTPAALTVIVTNAATGRPAAGGPAAGHGLRGMRERTAMLGGELSAGPAPDGEFVVRAVLPLAEAAR